MRWKILVADDDFDNRAIIIDALGQTDFETFQAVDGEEAVEVALKERPDLILLDLSMPQMSGWDVAKRIRQEPALAGTLILAFTAHVLNGDELSAKAAGCDDYIAKPCDPKCAVQKVRSWLAKGARTHV